MATTFWTLLGRACTQDSFRRTLRTKSAPGAQDMVDASALHGFLTHPGLDGPEPREAYRVARYEVMELNAVLLAPVDTAGFAPSALAVGDAGGPMAVIAQRIEVLWGGTPEDPELWQVIGLSIVDRPFRDAVMGAAVARDKVAFQAALTGPPAFQLKTDDRELLMELFQDEIVRDAIGTVESSGWKIIDPPGACSTGSTCTSLYVHDRVAADPEIFALGGSLVVAAGRPGPGRWSSSIN